MGLGEDIGMEVYDMRGVEDRHEEWGSVRCGAAVDDFGM
jgi:hypothetical protein